MAKALMICGTTSDAGKSLLVTGLCRLFSRRGLHVAPFKSQNMALNAYTTLGGGEIGLAQALQAEACGLDPDLRFNPVLLKPQGDSRSQVIVMGRPVALLGARDYHLDFCETAWKAADEALQSLRREYDLIFLEGAGSPAEMNIYHRDIANLRAARAAEAPVLLLGDIERGGVIASLVGTLNVLPQEDRGLIRALAVNKFRGDVSLFDDGRRYLEDRTGLPFLGVIPYAADLSIPAEDSLGIRDFGSGPLRIAVVALPHMANFSDFDAFAEEGCRVRFAKDPSDLEGADCIVLPGTKTTLADLRFLRAKGFDRAIEEAVGRGVPLWGICGGYQMLGRRLVDGVEEEGEAQGLGLLEATTFFSPQKAAFPAEAHVADDAPGPFSAIRGRTIRGYEIHSGLTSADSPPPLRLRRRGEEVTDVADGATAREGQIFGTYLHGLADDPLFRRALVNWLRERKGLTPLTGRARSGHEMRLEAYDRLADHLERNLDVEGLEHLIGKGL